jgi:hypothetical protein
VTGPVEDCGAYRAGIDTRSASKALIRVRDPGPCIGVLSNRIGRASQLAKSLVTVHTGHGYIFDKTVLLRQEHTNTGPFRVALLGMVRGTDHLADSAARAFVSINRDHILHVAPPCPWPLSE